MAVARRRETDMYEGNRILADEEEKAKRRELLEGRLIGKHLPRQKEKFSTFPGSLCSVCELSK